MDRRAIIAGGGTGGHLYPAINLAEALKRRSGDELEILLVGAERGIESTVLPELGVEHRLLPVEPIYRSRVWRNWRAVPAMFRSGRQIVELFRSFEPRLVVGTGGYAAGPLVAGAVYRRLPTAIQEQNSYPGLTTRWLAPHVDQVHLGRPEAMRYLETVSKSRIRVHGNPIRFPERRPDEATARATFGLGSGRVVLVIGGSQGARSINRALLEALSAVERGQLPPLPADTEILWSTGPTNHEEVVGHLAKMDLKVAVRPIPYIHEMEKALALTRVALSRAGAFALAELCAWGIPSILVPFPFGAADHQRRNARALESEEAAVVVEEVDLRRDSSLIWTALVDVLRDERRREGMAQAARKLGAPRAAEAIADDLLQLMEER